MVIDSESGKVIADIPGQKIAHGVAIVPEAGRGFISDGGGSGAVVIFDLKTNAVLGTIAAQPDADGIIFDHASGRVLVVSGDGGVLMSLKPDIDPKNGKIDAPIDLGGAPEFLASDGKGKVYVNLRTRDEVAVVDMKARKVVARWPVAPGGAPVGMSIDAKKGQSLHRVPQAPETDRDEHRRWQGARQPADRRRRRRHKNRRRPGIRQLPRRLARGRRREIARKVRDRADRKNAPGRENHGPRSHNAHDLSAHRGI